MYEMKIQRQIDNSKPHNLEHQVKKKKMSQIK